MEQLHQDQSVDLEQSREYDRDDQEGNSQNDKPDLANYIYYEEKKFRLKNIYTKSNGKQIAYYVCVSRNCSTLLHYDLLKNQFQKSKNFEHKS